MSEKITIIIPTFKRDDKFERALKSVVNQTYNNVEIIVVDDNADFPEYRKKIEDIISRYENVILIQNRNNLGGALSRNAGVKKASSNLIAFLDDDDEYAPDKVQKQYELYKKYKDKNLGLVFCNNRKINFNENIIFQHMKDIIATTSTWLIPKKVIEDLNYFEKLPSEQDTTFILKLLCAGYNVFCVPEDLVVRHFHNSEDGISGVKPSNIEGTELLREKCRLNYDKLDSKRQIRRVEYAFSKKLLPKYIYNHKKDDAKREMKNMLASRPFCMDTVKGLVRYLFPKKFVYEWYSKR
jgi:glycosyltransferase involved in cell wall biosynthesis